MRNRHRANRGDHPARSRQPRNPDWDADETLLGLDAYLRLRPLTARPELEVVQELSELLRLFGTIRGGIAGPTFRNPEGVARKVYKFSAAERGESPSTVRGAELEAVIWSRYGHDPLAVSRAADALRLRIYASAADQLDNSDKSLASEPTTRFQPSKGPAPSFGTRTSEFNDGECVIYVSALEGDVQSLFNCDLSTDMVVKVGRSNAVHRRLRELNAGIPPAMQCRWALKAVRPFQTAGEAHTAEQALIARLAADGRSLGGEFARVPRGESSQLLADDLKAPWPPNLIQG